MIEAFRSLVTSRRTVKDYDGRAVTLPQIRELLTFACLAPNHRLNQPWRFVAISQKEIRNFCRHIRSTVGDAERLSLENSLLMLQKAGALLYIFVEASDNAVIHEENFAAAAAATQNILLGATAMGIASFWSSSRLIKHPEAVNFFSLPSNRFVGCVWLGYAEASPPSKERKSVDEVTKFVGFDDR